MRQTPQTCKSPMQRQRFITAIKNVTEGEKKAQKPNQVSYCQQNQQLQQRGKKGKKKKSKRIYRASQNLRLMFFLSHCCQSPFCHWESQSTSPPQDALQHCADLWTCGGSSDSNLVHSYVFLPPKSTAIKTSVFSFVGVLNDLSYIFHRHRVCLVDRVDLF